MHLTWVGEPGGLLSMGSHRVGHDWGDLAAVAAATSLTQGWCVKLTFSQQLMRIIACISLENMPPGSQMGGHYCFSSLWTIPAIGDHFRPALSLPLLTRAHCPRGTEANTMVPAFEKRKTFTLKSTCKETGLKSVSPIWGSVKHLWLWEEGRRAEELVGWVSIRGFWNLATYGKMR